ncbi:MAG TPA: cell division protein ZapA [Desulfomicrobiaceae bacterium]|jgi:cell division protein ZapA|nr:cell division protein ZapA [Desulfomicrobiaceae bacterium]
MPGYTLNVLGLEVNFKAEASSARIERARTLLENRYEELNGRGRNLSKERLLIFLALGLADDYLQMDDRLAKLDEQLATLLNKIDSP